MQIKTCWGCLGPERGIYKFQTVATFIPEIGPILIIVAHFYN